MSRRLEECRRVLNEMRDRFGEDDPMVSRWMDELETKSSLEFRYPGKLRSRLARELGIRRTPLHRTLDSTASNNPGRVAGSNH